MKARIMIIITAVLLGVLAVAGVAVYVSAVKNQVAAEGKTVNAIVADKSIPAGTTYDELIKNDMVSLKKIPKRYLAAGAVQSTAQLAGRTASVDIGQGEQLTTGRFASSLTSGDVRIRIKNDLRAIAVPYDDVKAVAGSIAAGDLVDVVVTFDKDVAGTDTTKTILTNILVLSVGNNLTEPPPSNNQSGGMQANASTATTVKKTLVLAVPAADVEKLVFAENKGVVWLALVPAKAQTVVTSGQTAATVLGR